jgi:hypothetical protein
VYLVTSIMFLDIIHRLVHFLKTTTFRGLDSVSVLRYFIIIICITSMDLLYIPVLENT